MPATKDGFQFTEGDRSDLELLYFVYQLRLATIDHLAELAGRSYTRVHKRIAKLHEHGYLACIERRPEKHAYAIGSAAIPVLIEHGHAPRELAEKRLRHNERKELGIRHALFVASIHAKLMLLTRTGPVRIVNWVEGPSLKDRVKTLDENGAAIVIPVYPDVWFTIQHAELPEGKNKFNFFIEADRGSMSHERMRAKVRGFIAYFQQGLHTKKYGIKLFKVATICETKGRATELANTFRGMMEPAWSRAYPVTGLEDLTLEALMPEILQTGQV
jgi:hypothetical protein